MKNNRLLLMLLLQSALHTSAQNLPSLVTGRNINSTFSIVAYDPQAKEWGIAVATNNIYVGNSTIYIEPGVGAFSVIAETEPAYGLNGLVQLKQHSTIEQAIIFTKVKDSLADYRQVSGIDQQGDTYAFTGSSLKYWKGVAANQTGKNYVVMGNQLAPGTLGAMASTFEQAKGTLAERLLKSLLAGEKAGGQISGKQSAALVVKGTANEWFNQIDLRVDHSRDPFADLERLLNYHYGRIHINQASYAAGMHHKKRGEQLLQQAVIETKGWYGIYPKIAKTYLLLNNAPEALRLIKTAVKAEPKWKENVPAFYCLYHDPALQQLYPEKQFTVIDWNNAISMLTDLDRQEEAITLAKKVIRKYPSSSYTWYLLAKAQQLNGNLTAAQQANANALQFDPDNADARRLAPKLRPDTGAYEVINRALSVRSAGVSLSAAEGDGVAWLKGADFSNGTIEVDLKGKNLEQQSFLGIAFHGVDGQTLDAVYFRPFNFLSKDTVKRSHAVQYVAHPQYPWPVLRERFNGQYEKAVVPVPDPDSWFHIRIEVHYPEIKVYINHNPEPCLVVKQLNDRQSGKFGLWVGNNSGGEFANLKITNSH